MIRPSFTSAKGPRCGVVAWALACALAFSTLGAPAAFADVRATDEILGVSVEARGLPAVACPNVTATYALVSDDEGTVFFARDALTQTHIASITKVMTAIVALESGLPLDTTVTVTEEAAKIGESSANLRAGDTLTLEAALTGLMVSSGNDAAIAIASTVGETLKTSEGQSANEAFVAAMNAKAAELGMTETLFANPHGLDIGEYDNEMYSCARDVALMCAKAMENETFRSIVAKETAQITVKHADGTPMVIDLTSTDILLGTYEGACGVKTGYTEAAGNSFAGACNRGDGDLYAIVLGSPSESARFEDAEALFNWVYDNRVSYALAHSPESATLETDGATVPVIARIPHTAWPDRTVAATLADPKAAVEVFAPEGNVSQEIIAKDLGGAVSAGDVVGTANFYQGNELIATQDLIAVADAAAPNLLEGIGIWWNRLWGGDAPASLDIVNETPLIYSKSSTRDGSASLAEIASGDTALPAATDQTDGDAQPAGDAAPTQ
ncbi:D-alanyl-D-alanine carboxypeptidase family protein [uncultured Adlercreutzia sp.]|uniref:D-alanyl-D-alanine carboxypeptidase family protein n=1 Tax=uncultured Adlercreutzia sp. TaxID=875803 RepID=UPI0026F3F79C|nr:serine hydrolase [uncultured Adlercreutzia sp.]